MIIQFNGDVTFLKELDIDNLGEFAIEASNDEGMFWYYVVRTSLGTVTIATSGPRIPDIELLPKGFNQALYRIPYKEDKIIKDVSSFLNDPRKRIVKAELLDIDVAIEQFVNLRDYLENYSEELY